jgi:PKD repeat protein
LTIQHTYLANGSYTATLRVRDEHFAFSTPVTLLVQPGNTPPVASIQAPTVGATFAVGQSVTLTGSATDAQDGALPPSRLSWSVILHHDTHTHPFLGPISGNNVVFTAPAPEDVTAATNSYLEVQLTATDFSGATNTATRDLLPRKVDVTFASVPPGLGLTLNGLPLTAPQTVTSWEAWVLQAFAPAWQALGPDLYVFSSWSSGAGNQVALPTPAAAASFTATYQLSTISGAQGFFSLTPCRLLDTRNPNGPRGGPALSAGGTRNFTLTGVCNVPTTAKALAVNVTVTGPTAAGNLRLFAADQLQPLTSNLNFSVGQTRAANAIVRLGAAGDLSIFDGAASGTAHVILDVAGYFE